MARQTRRGRTSSARRRTQPALPHHLYPHLDDGSEAQPTGGEADTPAAEATTLTLEAAPPPSPAPVQRAEAPAPVVPAVRRGVAQRERATTGARLAVTDYGYVLPELKRIFAVAATVVILLIIIAIVHR